MPGVVSAQLAASGAHENGSMAASADGTTLDSQSSAASASPDGGFFWGDKVYQAHLERRRGAIQRRRGAVERERGRAHQSSMCCTFFVYCSRWFHFISWVYFHQAEALYAHHVPTLWPNPKFVFFSTITMVIPTDPQRVAAAHCCDVVRSWGGWTALFL